MYGMIFLKPCALYVRGFHSPKRGVDDFEYKIYKKRV